MSKELWNPLKDMEEFREKINDAFNDFWKNKAFFSNDTDIRNPLLDIVEKKTKFVAKVELPGISKKDVTVVIDGDRIEIKAKKKSELKRDRDDFYIKERSYSRFFKSFVLPQPVDAKSSKLEFKDGLLVLDLPKAKGVSKKKVLKLK